MELSKEQIEEWFAIIREKVAPRGMHELNALRDMALRSLDHANKGNLASTKSGGPTDTEGGGMQKLIQFAQATGRVGRPEIVHDYGCAATRWGKRSGPCNCPAQGLDDALDEHLANAGLHIWMSAPASGGGQDARSVRDAKEGA